MDEKREGEMWINGEKKQNRARVWVKGLRDERMS